jgi:Holliday junction resolvase
MSNKSKGNLAEQLVLDHLRSKGMIGEIIETKMRMARVGGRAILVPDGGEKLGDIFGLMHGKAVLVEVKAVPSLTYSILKEHQHENLRKWHECGGLAMVAWMKPCGKLLIIPYPMSWVSGENIEKYHDIPL